MKIKMNNINVQKSVHFFDAVINGEEIYFSSIDMNALFKIRKDSKLEFLGEFENEVLNQQKLHRKTIEIDNKIYFIPFIGKSVSIYDKNKKKIISLKCHYNMSFHFSNAFKIREDILMIPTDCMEPLVILHTKNDSFEILYDLQKEMATYLKHIEVYFDVYASLLIDDKLYLVPYNTNLLFEINIFEKKCILYKLKKKYHLRNLYYEKENFYFIMSDQYLVLQWNIKTNEYCEYNLPRNKMVEKNSYMSFVSFKERLFLIPDKEDLPLEFDKNNKKWIKNTDIIPNKFYRESNACSLFMGFKVLEDKILLYPRGGNGLITFDGKKSCLKSYTYATQYNNLFKKSGKQRMEIEIKKEKIIIEDFFGYTNLNQLMEFLFEYDSSFMNEYMENGKNIWKML